MIFNHSSRWLPRPLGDKCLAIVLTLMLHCHSIAVAGDRPVRRLTDSADADLITELLATGMVDTAIKICERYTTDSQTDSDDKARWLIQWSRAKVAAMLRDRPAAEQSQLEETTLAIDAFIANNPAHPRLFWLNFQRLLVELAAAKRAVLIAMVRSPDDPDRDKALTRIVRVAGAMRELSKSIEDQIAIERTKSTDSVAVQDLVSLAVIVATKRIDAVMVRGDLFEESSNDYISAANDSMNASRALLSSMRSGAEGRDDLVRQLSESLRRTGDLEQAYLTLAPLVKTDLRNDETLALATRIAIDRGDLATAESLLQPSVERDSSSGVESDLMRLQLAIVLAKSAKASTKQSNQSQREIGDWIDRIGKRHGDYARRRAEKFVLGTSTASSPLGLDPRVIIAQAASRMRDGHADQAAQFLASAARATTDPAAAIQLSIAGAAAFRKANDIKNAASLLREISLTHFTNQDAAKLHLQSALLLADTSSPESLIEHLQECKSTWPVDASSATATDWIVRLHEARQEWESAARAASSGNAQWMTPERIATAVDLWIKAISLCPISERDGLANQASESFAIAGLSELSRTEALRLTTLFRDRSAISGLEGQQLASPWMRWLLGIRQGAAVTEMPATSEADRQLASVAADRLIGDGEVSKLNQARLAQAIVMLVGQEPSLRMAQGVGWTGDWKRSEALIEELITKHPADSELAKEAAGLLSRADDATAKRAGLRLWITLSSQLPQGSAQWHQAKLSAIETMRSLGDIEEAKKLASYVMLTQPPADPAIIARYRLAMGSN